jgi:hypothetical protein
MKNTLTIFLLLFFLQKAQAQMTSMEAMGKLSFLVGEWEGNAKAMTGPGKVQLIDQHENVQLRLGGQILVIEGMGYQQGELVFNAMALVTFDTETQQYEMQSWLASGEKTNAYFKELSPENFEWGFPLPNGQIRYFISLDEEGRWKENGEFSPDGKNWYPSFEMLLTKKQE